MSEQKRATNSDQQADPNKQQQGLHNEQHKFDQSVKQIFLSAYSQGQNQRGIYPDLNETEGKSESKGEASLEEDPKESSNEFKIEIYKNLLRKTAEQNKEKQLKITQLCNEIEYLKINQEKMDSIIKEKALNPYQEKIFRSQQNTNDWKEKLSELQESHKVQVQKLQQGFTAVRQRYQSDINELKIKLQECEQSERTKTKVSQQKCAELVEQRNKLKSQLQKRQAEIKNEADMKQKLKSELATKVQMITNHELLMKKLEQRVVQLEMKIETFKIQALQSKNRYEQELKDVKVRQVSQIEFYSTKLADYENSLNQQKEKRNKDTQRLMKLQEKVQEFEHLSTKAKQQVQDHQTKSNHNLLQAQKLIRQYHDMIDSLNVQKDTIKHRSLQLQRQSDSYQKQLYEQKQHRERLQNEVNDLIQQKSQVYAKVQFLQGQISQLKSVAQEKQSQRKMYVEQIHFHQNTIKSKELKIKSLEQKCEKIHGELQKSHEAVKLLEKEAKKNASNLQELHRSQVLKKQNVNKLKMLQQQKERVQNELKKELANKTSFYDVQLKRAKIEKDKLQQRCKEQTKKYDLLLQEAKKTKQVAHTQDEKITELKKLVKKYQNELQLKDYHIKMQKVRFQEIIRVKQRELGEKNQKIQSIIHSKSQMEAQFKKKSEIETKESKLSLFFDLLKGFKSKMPAAQFNTLRSRISFMMN